MAFSEIGRYYEMYHIGMPVIAPHMAREMHGLRERVVSPSVPRREMCARAER